MSIKLWAAGGNKDRFKISYKRDFHILFNLVRHLQNENQKPPDMGVYFQCPEEGLFHDPREGISNQKAGTPCRNFIFTAPIKASFERSVNKNCPERGNSIMVLRRERDSNPRRLAPQRFSRPPHSTALPSLRGKNTR